MHLGGGDEVVGALRICGERWSFCAADLEHIQRVEQMVQAITEEELGSPGREVGAGKLWLGLVGTASYNPVMFPPCRQGAVSGVSKAMEALG